MEFADFKEKVIILKKEEGNVIREKYINKFVDTEKESYKKNIQILHKLSDGYCYLGYLWDCIKNPVMIDSEYIKLMAESEGMVYVFWDIHSCERIFIDDYWKFGKDTVLKVDFKTLIQGEEYLPEDIYIFDENITWTLIPTHEDINGKRYCIKSGDIKKG